MIGVILLLGLFMKVVNAGDDVEKLLDATGFDRDVGMPEADDEVDGRVVLIDGLGMVRSDGVDVDGVDDVAAGSAERGMAELVERLVDGFVDEIEVEEEIPGELLVK